VTGGKQEGRGEEGVEGVAPAPMSTARVEGAEQKLRVATGRERTPCARAGLFHLCWWRDLLGFSMYHCIGKIQETHGLSTPRTRCMCAQNNLVLSLLQLACAFEVR